MTKPRNAYCSFCRKSYRDVGPLVEGPGNVYICAQCVELCQSIIVQEKRRRQRSEESLPSLPEPEVIQALLNFYLRTPRMNTKAITAAVLSHWEDRRITRPPEGKKSILLLVGTSRSSAVFLARVLAHILDVPFASGQAKDLASTCSPTEPSESVFFKLLQAGDFDANLAQLGIVFLDGIDSSDVQEMMVNVLEEKSLAAVPHALQIDVASILFICRGSFDGLEEQMVRRGRHPEQPITNDDLLASGVWPEFMRRVRAIIPVSPLDEETVVRLIASADLKRWPNDSNI